jgi:hypothetical protein
MDKLIFKQAVDVTNFILKEIALNNVNDKYQWNLNI